MIEDQWLKNDIEELSACPLCQCRKSSVLFNSLVDMMMPKSSDRWILKKCTECNVAYLSPRPNKKNINKAYINYYTHGDENGMIKKGKSSIFINYIKKVICKVKYKRDFSFKEFIIYLLVFSIYPVYLFLDAKIRHIGTFKDNKNRLLDIGCGNGGFLVFANDLGWDVMGLDVDESAVNSALSKGVNVQLGGIESLNKEDMFDMITLNHVIEHVYNPVELIQECYKHLNPGGKLWLETPNINSIGLDIYKEYWRGLEPPRHLILYNACTLSKLLSDAGFLNINQKTHGLSGVYMGLQSEKNIAGFKSYSLFFNKLFKWPRILFVEIVQLLFKRKSEFITLIAYK
ncbi:MAG: class I SAM-dependent methyltransferase [Methylococcaceae bacterium]|nr:class I SAM-dependent methyltransferase [Methylococcaceae bacterium]